MKKLDVQVFSRQLEDNLFALHHSLTNKTYRHGKYISFWVDDPKQRHIHKASVGDRVVHHLLYTHLYRLFDPTFIYDTYACRQKKGIPLGNLTSQVFANMYLHEFDMYMKHTLKMRYYIRYADDFVIAYSSKQKLEKLIAPISNYLREKLILELHPHKITIRKLSWGIDFLGYIILPHYRLPRTKTKHRMLRHIVNATGRSKIASEQMIQSYLGYLSHVNAYTLSQLVRNLNSILQK
ncbi:RNA-directed DNA polymerase [Candidatus Gottesmanbacteria bacterium]|nr:RNA-directed DNA polymerase [Candidatus Gottesmanbacteria bacterium]